MVNSFTWMIGGPQGSGINSVAESFAKACIRGGLHVFANIEYHSNIKVEHSYYRLRVDSWEPRSHVDWVDLLVALDRETMFGDLNKVHPTHRGHRHEVSPGGGIVYDSSLKLQPESFGRDDIKLFPVPYMDLLIDALKEFGKDKELSKYQVMVNTIALGASIGLVDYDFDLATEAIKEGFTGRKAALGDLNISAARHGYDYAKKMFGQNAFPIRLRKQPLGAKRMMIRGVQSIAIGKLKAGCGFQTYYPITPATDESEYLESHQPDYNMIVVQAEDEISAINIATGAAHAGLRSSTSTSGPGFSLMAEGLGWAGITEAPGPVIILWQRAGPATGLPTRTEQADLRFALHAAHGEFPRIIIAPGDGHDEYGHITEAADLRVRMMKKRMNKIQLAGQVIPNSKKATLYGPTSAPITLVGWGSTKGAILDGMEDLRTDGIETNFLQVRYVNPFPTDFVQKVLSSSRLTVAVENNYSGQMAGLIRERTGIAVNSKVVKFDGRPFSQNEVYEGVKDVVRDGAKEVTLSHA